MWVCQHSKHGLHNLGIERYNSRRQQIIHYTEDSHGGYTTCSAARDLALLCALQGLVDASMQPYCRPMAGAGTHPHGAKQGMALHHVSALPIKYDNMCVQFHCTAKLCCCTAARRYHQKKPSTKKLSCFSLTLSTQPLMSCCCCCCPHACPAGSQQPPARRPSAAHVAGRLTAQVHGR